MADESIPAVRMADIARAAIRSPGYQLVEVGVFRNLPGAMLRWRSGKSVLTGY